MQVILLEKIRNLGELGDNVNVANGYGRNFLLPQGKAVSATKDNLEKLAMKANFLVLLEQRILLIQFLPKVLRLKSMRFVCRMVLSVIPVSLILLFIYILMLMQHLS